jgi:hypothetical protein
MIALLCSETWCLLVGSQERRQEVLFRLIPPKMLPMRLLDSSNIFPGARSTPRLKCATSPSIVPELTGILFCPRVQVHRLSRKRTIKSDLMEKLARVRGDHPESDGVGLERGLREHGENSCGRRPRRDPRLRLLQGQGLRRIPRPQSLNG